MSSLAPAADVPINIRSDNASSERRVTPAWTIAHFKTRLEPITGIPSTSQKLALSLGPSQAPVPLEALDEDATQLSAFPLQPYAEIHVQDTRPAHLRPSYALTDSAAAAVPKYTMPPAQYDQLSDSVLAFKRANKLGRFDPAQPAADAAALARSQREAAERHVAVGRRARLLAAEGAPRDERRGDVRFLGVVPELPGPGVWVGVALDEPTGKNDGSVKGGKRYFECARNCGVFVRPERVEVGDFKVLDELDENMEEI